MLPHETRKDNKDGQTLKKQLAETNPPGTYDKFLNKQSTNPVPDEVSIGQHTGKGKPPLTNK